MPHRISRSERQAVTQEAADRLWRLAHRDRKAHALLHKDPDTLTKREKRAIRKMARGDVK